MSYRNGYPRQWFRPEPRAFATGYALAWFGASLFCAGVWVGVGYVAWWVL